MYNRYTCSLQAYRHLTLKLLIQGHPRSGKVSHVADFKSAYKSLIIDPRALACETNLWEIMGWKSSDVFRFDFGSSFNVKRGEPNLKVLIIHLLLVLEVLQCETNLQEFMD